MFTSIFMASAAARAAIAGGLLAAFCCPTPPDPAWELLYGEDAAQLLL